MVFNFFAFNVLPPKEHESGNRYFFPVLFTSGMCPSADPQKAQMQVSASPFIWCLEKCINAIVIGIFSELQDPKEQTAWAQAFFHFTSTFTGFFGSWSLTFRRRLTRRFQKTGRDDAIWKLCYWPHVPQWNVFTSDFEWNRISGAFSIGFFTIKICFSIISAEIELQQDYRHYDVFV